MKLCRLKLKNLNSFRDPIDIDFEKSHCWTMHHLWRLPVQRVQGKRRYWTQFALHSTVKRPRLSGNW